jgi:hypothetical protein
MESSMKYSGLTVEHGRLINNRPTDKTGIQEMAENRRVAKAAKKVSMHVDAIMMAKRMEHMGGCMDCGR